MLRSTRNDAVSRHQGGATRRISIKVDAQTLLGEGLDPGSTPNLRPDRMRGRISLAACFSIWWLNPNAACWSVRASGMPWSRSLIARGRGWRPSTMASAGAPRAPSWLCPGRRGLSLLRSLHNDVSCARRTSPCACHRRCTASPGRALRRASPSRAGAAFSAARSAAKDHAAEAAESEREVNSADGRRRQNLRPYD